MKLNWLSYNDIEMGLKKKVDKLFNNAENQTLIWDSKTRQYIGHLDTPSSSNALEAGHVINPVKSNIEDTKVEYLKIANSIFDNNKTSDQGLDSFSGLASQIFDKK